MSFEKLHYATRLVSGSTRYHEIVGEWHLKRQQLAVQLEAFPFLIEAYKFTEGTPYEKDSRIKLSDPFPRLHLANACESTVNALYSLAEVASHFANRVSTGRLPSSFNSLKKKVEIEQVDEALIAALGDLQWYRKVRKLRTEWVHYSTIFICEDQNGEPMISVRSYRRPSDKSEILEQTQYLVTEVVDWVRKAIITVDAYGSYLLSKYVMHRFNPDEIITVTKYDENGYPLLLEDFRFKVEKITIKEYMCRGGITI
ncbi:MAG: hypothetical protein KME45_06495 [Stenomitos rutilans HA7619-LM2]|nr:hypothetical protein [Stenomitos rutilans HA7619-LM2]